MSKSTPQNVCPNHPDTVAVSRCVTCFKPLCKACITSRNGQDFCSEKCAENAAATNQSIAAQRDRDRKRKKGSKLKKLVILIILIALGAAAYRYYVTHKDEVDKAIRGGTEKLGDLKKQVESGIPDRHSESTNLD